MSKRSTASKMEIQRKKKNMSRRVLAEKIGVDITTIWRWETGKVVPHPAMAKLWAQSLEP